MYNLPRCYTQNTLALRKFCDNNNVKMSVLQISKNNQVTMYRECNLSVQDSNIRLYLLQCKSFVLCALTFFEEIKFIIEQTNGLV